MISITLKKSGEMKILLLISILILSSCSFFESDYDKLMNPIKEMKLAEKKAGKPNPTFDGVVEPDFPDEKLNNDTLEGVDSNKDGVRDDVEIWINRVAEDEYVRLSLKHLYIKYFSVHMAVWKDEPIELQNKKSWESTTSLGCLSTVLWKYEKDNLLRGIEKDRLYFDQISTLTFNNPTRSNLAAKINSYQGMEGPHGEDDNKFCHPKISQDYLKDMNIKHIKDYEKNNDGH